MVTLPYSHSRRLPRLLNTGRSPQGGFDRRDVEVTSRVNPPEINITQENKTTQSPPHSPPRVSNQERTAFKEVKGERRNRNGASIRVPQMSRNRSLHSHTLPNRSLQLLLNNCLHAFYLILKTHLILLFNLHHGLPSVFFFQFLPSPSKTCTHYSSIPHLSLAQLLPP